MRARSILPTVGLAAVLGTLASFQPAIAQEMPGTGTAQVCPSGFQDLQKLARMRLEAEKPAVAEPGPIAVGVDERMELLTVIFRLAGAPEFAGNGFAPYAAAVDTRFRPYAEHPAVKFAGRMRMEVGVGADGVGALAAHLSPLPALEPPESFNGTAVEGRWRSADARQFASLAREFARESNFAEFLDESRPVYELAALRMRMLVHRDIDPAWFAGYFGPRPNSRMLLSVGLLNGNISYGFDAKRAGQPDELYAVIGTWQFDEKGLPVYDESTTPTLVHEFCHSFVDPAVKNRAADFKAAGAALQPVFALHLPRMRQYYWRTLFEESLVRAAVARYLLAHKGPQAAREELTRQAANGFVWIDGLYDLLDEYEQNRDRYPTFEQFLPRVVDFFTNLPRQLPEIVDGVGDSAPEGSR